MGLSLPFLDTNSQAQLAAQTAAARPRVSLKERNHVVVSEHEAGSNG